MNFLPINQRIIDLINRFINQKIGRISKEFWIYFTTIVSIFIISIMLIITRLKSYDRYEYSYLFENETNFYYCIPLVVGIFIILNIGNFWTKIEFGKWLKIFIIFSCISSLITALGRLLWELELFWLHLLAFGLESLIFLLATLFLYYDINEIVLSNNSHVHERDYPWYALVVVGTMIGILAKISGFNDQLDINGLVFIGFSYVTLLGSASLFYLAIWRHFLSGRLFKSCVKAALLLLPIGIFFEAIADIIFINIKAENINIDIPLSISMMDSCYAIGYFLYAISIGIILNLNSLVDTNQNTGYHN